MSTMETLTEEASTPTTQPAGKAGEDEVLLAPFERDFPSDYKEYYKTKRHNLLASISGFRELWGMFMALDKIFLREFADMSNARDTERVLPLTFFYNAHAKMRVALELAFQGCLQEARSILRDAIDYAAHGHYTLGDVELQKIWVSKSLDEVDKAFKQAFEKDKTEKLFKGLDELRRRYNELSEMGSHATPLAMSDRVNITETKDGLHFMVNYSGVDEKSWALQLFTMLLTCFGIEQTLFEDYKSRLQLDPTLMRMRADFERNKELLRQTLIKRYDVEPPK